MESIVMENSHNDVDKNQKFKNSQSAENFQKFMYELFEKNGVMNDLRSYLRGHIVNVLRSAQTGNPPSCQKHFTQRLELTFQALNILIAEYLMRLEFSYTLSVFISEIPLANMVFSFAKALMNKVENDDSRPRFKDSDVWCILNYLGVKCDSEHATSIVEMYRLEKNSPLLLCILKSAPLFKEPILIEQLNSSQETLASSIQSSESVKETDRSPQKKPSFQEKCRHYVFCKTCQSKMVGIKEKYKKKKKDIAENLKESSLNSLNVGSMMENISLLERSLIDEMFDQLKSVYEAEIELLKEEEDKRVKRSLASHSTQLQKRRDEMEECFKAREAELVSGVQQKKRFLWGLARALRDQHETMRRAMHDVRAETNRLTDKEASLKTQLAEAEQILRQRGEDMRHQISEELTVLEGHLESMKRERDTINRERTQLEQYKDHTVKHIENEDLKPHYELLKNELSILKKYLESAKLQPKCVIERSTITELSGVSSRIDVVMNNGREESKTTPKQLVNDLKKPKNVNFSQSNLDEIYRERSRSRSRSSASSEAGDALFDADRDSMQRLRDENEQLRCFAAQQRSHIDNLSSQQARLQAELTASRMRAAVPVPVPAPAPARPRTAPTPAAYALEAHNQRMSASASINNFGLGWRKGAGEELSLFSNAQPRILIPGDVIPFVGVVSRHTDNRRYLINQWRSLRRRISPLGGVTKPRASSPVQRNLKERIEAAGPSIRFSHDEVANSGHPSQRDIERSYPPEYRPQTSALESKQRDKSPKSVLKEAKAKLRNKDIVTDYAPKDREKSPNCILREAKLRLRKLEIEAEAVEKSYLDFRRNQAFRGERESTRREEKDNTWSSTRRLDLDPKPSTSTYRLDKTYNIESSSHYQEPRSTNEYDRCFKEYQTKLSFGEHFKNNNAANVSINPIPSAFSTQETEKTENYLETPLREFRKYYHTDTSERNNTPTRPKSPKSVSEALSVTKGTRKEILRQAKNDKVKELELLKLNISKIYNMPEQAIVETPTNESNNEDENKNDSANEHIENDAAAIENNYIGRNLLRVEVESVSEINDLKPTEPQGMLLLVESSVDNNKDAVMSDLEMDKEGIPTQMTIIISPKGSPRQGFSEIINRNESSDRSERNECLSESIQSSRKASIKSPRKIPVSGNSRSVDSDIMTTKKVVAIYHSDNESSVQMELNMSKDVLVNAISDQEHEDLRHNEDLEHNDYMEHNEDLEHEDLDYPDDFSADVDNYNSRSEYEHLSPISLPKSEDENFWDS